MGLRIIRVTTGDDIEFVFAWLVGCERSNPTAWSCFQRSASSRTPRSCQHDFFRSRATRPGLRGLGKAQTYNGQSPTWLALYMRTISHIVTW